ncbi:MAG TPA: DMT family transporter [Candidatus Polarisedimenticolia bacterium]|nr:DMT family transporter [Candidatus Polarisedimenticolia bacterium]
MHSAEIRRPFPPAAVLVVAVLAISWGSILVRYCTAGPLAIACLRLTFATLFLAPFVLPGLGRAAPRPRAAWRTLLAAGFLALHFGAWIASLRLTSIGSSVLLVSTQPLFSAQLSGAWLGERPGKRFYAGIAICLAGMLLLTGADFGSSRARLLGDALALLAAAAGAAYFVLGRSVRSDVPFGAYLFLVYGAAGAFLAVAAFLAHQPLIGFPSREFLPLAAMALFPSVLGHGGLNYAVRHLPAFTVSLAALGEPVLATLLARWLFDEPLSAGLLAGGSLILAGMLLAAAPAAKVQPA